MSGQFDIESLSPEEFLDFLREEAEVSGSASVLLEAARRLKEAYEKGHKDGWDLACDLSRED